MKLKLPQFFALLLLFGLFAFTQVPINTKEPASVGTYTLSLNVKDIEKSKDFYQHLGFQPVEGKGSIAQKWLILTNGEITIGLFQGMFPANTITFNPVDARSIHQHLKEAGITPAFESGFDQEEGPCAFSIVDPDGNPILIDQH